MDFYDYWYQKERAESKQPVIGLCMNTTFYLTDNPPQKGRLCFLSDFFLNRFHLMYVHTPTIQTIAKILFRFGVTTNYMLIYTLWLGMLSFSTATFHIKELKLGATIRINLVRILFYTTSKTRCFQAYDSLAIHNLLWIS